MSTYDYERLGPEHFQLLCQAILVREFSNVQCLPVGMPDGGRDAVVQEGHLKNAIIFQVKFNRDPAGLTSDQVVEWLEKAIDGEKEKIERLAARGAKQFVLITNISTTSHLDAGRLDRIQRYLDSKLPVRSMCWWRNELDRRLDSNWDLKLRYPAILNGSDLIRLVWEAVSVGESYGRRQSALNAYLGHQYRQDSTVRFKQVELVSKSLFDLFLDVPIGIRPRRAKTPVSNPVYLRATGRIRAARAIGRRRIQSEEFAGADGTIYYDRARGEYRSFSPGAAELLTDPEFGAAVPWIVLEGAPGQGKSTLTQYLAQIHRVRILERRTETGRLAQRLQDSPVLLPLRLELRDLAAWLRGIDPWDSNPDQTHNRARTLEGAIAAHIERYSGGIPFDVADLHQVLRSCPSLLLLDALDEVADLSDRANVVQAVSEALERFRGNSIAPQVLITSRPTAVAGSPTFTDEAFFHMTLRAIDSDLAREYAQKWIKARKLDEKDRTEVIATFEAKIKVAHIAELAKNTMQLSILLSLLHLHGSSLPDKRTELYNSYFEIFLNRESEKSAVVRNNRALLVDIHRYLGFYLHANAERDKTSGRIAYDDLKQLLRTYLTKEDQPVTLIDELLTGMVERFGALVSRVEGKYEFEVQPLREYFAGRHLYDTAPYSPPGRESPGTKPDRFDGLAPNPYWFNVTRFFAGCFSKGELADLANRVCDLVNSQKSSPYARTLAVALLKDWVFSQVPKAVHQVVETVFDDVGLRWAATGDLDPDAGSSSARSPLLPPGAGAEQLVAICWERLERDSDTDRARSLCRLLLRQVSPATMSERWLAEYWRRKPESRAPWLRVGVWLNTLTHLHPGDVAAITRNDDSPRTCTKAVALVAGRAPMDALKDAQKFEIARAILNCPGHSIHRDMLPWDSAVSLFGYVVSPTFWLELLRMHMIVSGGTLSTRARALARTLGRSSTARSLKNALTTIPELCEMNPAADLNPWIALVSLLDTEFGISWTSIELGVMGAGIRNAAERGTGAEELFCRSQPLPKRVRAARRLGVTTDWWLKQYESVADQFDAGLWILAVYVWASPQLLLELIPQVDSLVKELAPESRARLIQATGRAEVYRGPRRGPLELDPGDSAFGCLSMDSWLLLLPRLHRDSRNFLVRTLCLPRVNDPRVASICLDYLIDDLLRGEDEPSSDVFEQVCVAHEAGGRAEANVSPGKVGRMVEISTPLVESLWSMPTVLVSLLPPVLVRQEKRARAVWQIAEKEKWFG